MRALTIYETQNFTRGLDPKVAMGTGAWQNLRERSVLKGKDVSLLERVQRLNNYENFMYQCYFEVVSVRKNVILKRNSLPFDLEVEMHMFRSLEDFEEAEKYSFWIFRGSYEQFNNCFNIIKL